VNISTASSTTLAFNSRPGCRLCGFVVLPSILKESVGITDLYTTAVSFHDVPDSKFTINPSFAI
jgi:hypothetical protein